MKRNIFFYALGMLFFTAMNFGMHLNKNLSEGQIFMVSSANPDKCTLMFDDGEWILLYKNGLHSQEIDKALPKFKPGKPLKKILILENLQKNKIPYGAS